MSIKHLLCAEQPTKRWEATIQTQTAHTEPSQSSASWLGKVAGTHTQAVIIPT